jgi:hypothetical protein
MFIGTNYIKTLSCDFDISVIYTSLTSSPLDFYLERKSVDVKSFIHDLMYHVTKKKTK